MPRRSSAQMIRVSRPRSSSRLTSRVVGARREGGRAGELLHPHVPAVLAAQRVEDGELHHRQLRAARAQRALELGLDAPVQGRERAPALGTDLDGVVSDSHGLRIACDCAIDVASQLVSFNLHTLSIAHASNHRTRHRFRRTRDLSAAGRLACRSALLALAIGGFGIGLTEFVIAGLLPEVAADVRRRRGRRRLADLRLRAQRRGRRDLPDRRGHPAATASTCWSP